MVRTAAQEKMPTLKVGILKREDNMHDSNHIAVIQGGQARAFTRLETTSVSPAVHFPRGLPAAFSFVEVLITLAIVSILLLEFLRLHLINITMTGAAEITSKAVLLANEKIAETLAAGFPSEGTNSGTVEDDGLTLNWKTQVTDLHLPPLDEAGVKGLRKVLVHVSWTYGVHRKHLQMLTYVGDRRINEE